jgi:hypothetical protein
MRTRHPFDPAPTTPKTHYICITCHTLKEVACFRKHRAGWQKGLPFQQCMECTAAKRKARDQEAKALRPTAPAVRRVHLKNYREWREAFDQEPYGRRIAGRASVPTGEREEGS